MKTKQALVLSGGGFKGAFQMGALDYLRENGLIDASPHFDVIAGISAGALNGAFIATQQYDQLKDIWQRIEREGSQVVYTSEFLNEEGEPLINYDVLRSRFFPNYQLRVGVWRGLQLLLFPRRRNQFFQEQIQVIGQEVIENLGNFQAVASNQPLAGLLQKYLSIDQIPANTMFTSGFVSLVDGNYYNPQQYDYATNEDFLKGILASTTVPVVWPPVNQVNLQKGLTSPITQLIDGGLKNSSPLGDVIKLMDQDEEDAEYRILIINNNSGTVEKQQKCFNIASIALRSLTEITLVEIFNNDIREFVRINALVRQAQEQGVQLFDEKGRPLRRFYYKIVQPLTEELGDPLDATPEMLRKRYTLGRERAEAVFSQQDDPDWPEDVVV